MTMPLALGSSQPYPQAAPARPGPGMPLWRNHRADQNSFPTASSRERPNLQVTQRRKTTPSRAPPAPHPRWRPLPWPYLHACCLELMPRRGYRRSLPLCTWGRRPGRRKVAPAPCLKKPTFGPILPNSAGDHQHLEPQRVPSIHQRHTHKTQLWRGRWDRTPLTCTAAPRCPHTKNWVCQK